jgi:hypothetical protein
MSNEKGPETYPGLFQNETLKVNAFKCPASLSLSISIPKNISRRVSQSPPIYLDDDHSADDEADYHSRQHVIL